MSEFYDVAFLFSSNIKNRFFIRLNLLEAAMLYKYASKVDQDIVEIGTKYGGSAVLMASALKGENKVYTIDILSYDKQRKNLLKICPKEISNRIEFIFKESTEVAKGWSKKLGLVFFDGRHGGFYLKKDVDSWKGHIFSGGYAAFHDVLGYKPQTTPSGKKGRGKLHKGVPDLVPVLTSLKKEGWTTEGASQSLVVMKKP